jgi:hypothetical protein
VKNLRGLQNSVYQLGADFWSANDEYGQGRPSCDVGRIIRRDPRLKAVERINIYVNAYFYRLLECLLEEYPATAAVIGSNDFVGLVHDYLACWPPTEPSIFYAGRHLAAFLRNHSLVGRFPFVPELARLEERL